MASYGIPYQGSKNLIAEYLINKLPPADTFVDIFGGGCAMTHAAIVSGKYKNFIVNDISDAPQIFADAVGGRLTDRLSQWYSREDFYNGKDDDTYLRILWSFSNNQREYLYAQELEDWKLALHNARILGDVRLLRSFGIAGSGSLSDVRANIESYKLKYLQWYLYNKWGVSKDVADFKRDLLKDVEIITSELRDYLLNSLRLSGLKQSDVNRRLGSCMAGHYFCKSQWAFPTAEVYKKMQDFMPLPIDYTDIALQLSMCKKVGIFSLLDRSGGSFSDLEHLKRARRVASLAALHSRVEVGKNLVILQRDYRDVEIPHDAVIYCDPPYIGTVGYNVKFYHEEFYNWIKEQRAPVYISEYTMPKDFKKLAMVQKASTFAGAGAGNKRLECLYSYNGELFNSQYLLNFDYE